MRKLASVRSVDDIKPIAGADAIECAIVGGWKVVVKKNEYKPGDKAVYFEVDSWIPHKLAPFLSKGREPREYNGIPGERLRTVKLRGQLSQGLLLPLSVLPAGYGGPGEDVGDCLNIQRYEVPIPACLAGEMRGEFPSFIEKTDQERIQNLSNELAGWAEHENRWEVTEKLDGASMTVYVNGEDHGVCSRNINLRQTENNTFWQVATNDDLILKLTHTCNMLCKNLALQGELIGPGIQGNPYKLSHHSFYLFDVYDIDKATYLPAGARNDIAQSLGLLQAPCVQASCDLIAATVDSILEYANGKSLVASGVNREGLVFKSMDGKLSFKAISNQWLLKEKISTKQPCARKNASTN